MNTSTNEASALATLGTEHFPRRGSGMSDGERIAGVHAREPRKLGESTTTILHASCAVLDSAGWLLIFLSTSLLAADDLPDPLRPDWAKSRPRQGAAVLSSDFKYSGSTESPTYARNMANDVVNALDGLCQLVADNLDRLREIKKAANKLELEIRKLESEKQSKLYEYASGQYCSGCGKTRSEILAGGEQFPHQGQRIVVPTPAQIAAKERELETPIAGLRGELASKRKLIEQLEAVDTEGLAQIRRGILLWRTAVTFEVNLVLKAAEEEFRESAENKKKIEGRHSELRLHRLDVVDKAQIKLLEKEELLWNGLLEKLKSRLHERQQLINQAVLSARENKLSQYRRISGFVERINPFSEQPWDVMSYEPASWIVTDAALGEEFKFGQLKTKGVHFNAGEEYALTRVKLFIARFNATRPKLNLSEATGKYMSVSNLHQDELLLLQNASAPRTPAPSQRTSDDLPRP